MLSNEVCRRAKHSSGFVRFFSNPILIVLTVAFFLLLLLTSYPAQAATETILYNFTCGATDGCNPAAGVVLDSNGNLYGTTPNGGAYGGGVVFELSTSGTLTILHSFNPVYPWTDGFNPQAGVVFGPDGSLYGTTLYGGTDGLGTVYRVTPSGTETVLYNFTGGADGCYLQAGVVFDSEANLYGTAPDCGAYGWGTVFELSPSDSGIGTGAFTTLYSFTGGADGGYPLSGLLLGPKENNLYGTTYQGGTHGFGTVFKVNISSSKETVLHSFNANGKDGFHPEAGLIPGPTTGTVIGTTERGGAVGVGTIFEASTSGTETIIYSFQAGKDGWTPLTAIVATGKDEGCGVTWNGGTHDLGTVYCGNTSGAETVLHSFVPNGKDGYNPIGPLVLDKSGNLYGTTANGGNGGCGVYGCGTVFKIVR